MSNQLLTKREAAKCVGISVRSFERWVQPSIKLVRVGGSVRVPSSEIERWIEREMKRRAA